MYHRDVRETSLMQNYIFFLNPVKKVYFCNQKPLQTINVITTIYGR